MLVAQSVLPFQARASHVEIDGAPEEEAEVSSSHDSKATDTKVEQQHASRSRQQDQQEGNLTVSTRSGKDITEDNNVDKSDTSTSAVVRGLVQDIMTKAAAEAKGVAAETKEAEKLAASAAKSPKPKDEVALKKGNTGKSVTMVTFSTFQVRSALVSRDISRSCRAHLVDAPVGSPVEQSAYGKLCVPTQEAFFVIFAFRDFDLAMLRSNQGYRGDPRSRCSCS